MLRVEGLLRFRDACRDFDVLYDKKVFFGLSVLNATKLW